MLVLKFAGIDTISDAEPLVGAELQLPSSERAALEPAGRISATWSVCKVFDGDREIGPIEDVTFGAGEAPLLVVKSGAKLPTRFRLRRRTWRKWIWHESRSGCAFRKVCWT